MTAERVKVCANQSLAISDDGFGYLYTTDTDADEGAEQTWVAAAMTRGLHTAEKANSLGYEFYVSGVSGRISVRQSELDNQFRQTKTFLVHTANGDVSLETFHVGIPVCGRFVRWSAPSIVSLVYGDDYLGGLDTPPSRVLAQVVLGHGLQRR